MESQHLSAWTALSAEKRRHVVAVREQVLLDALQSSMKSLLQEEIQKQGQGEAFDKSTLVLTSGMEFDAPPAGTQAPLAMVWPMRLHEDPLFLVNCVTETLGSAYPWKALPIRRWADIVVPPPTTWPGFERSLARLVQQLIMQALPAIEPPRMSWAAMSSPNCDPMMGINIPEMTLDTGANNDDENDNDNDNDDNEDNDNQGKDEGTAKVASTARAAKRLRQRERRKLGRRLMAQGLSSDVEAHMQSLAAAAAAGGNCNPVSMSNSRLDPSAQPFTPSAAALMAASGPGATCAATPVLIDSSTAAMLMAGGRMAMLGGASQEAVQHSKQAGSGDSTRVGSSSESGHGEGEGSGTTSSPSGRGKNSGSTEALTTMDGLQERLELALGELDAGKAETCREQLLAALSICKGLTPYLERVNKPMSQNWERLQRTTHSLDWKELSPGKTAAMAPGALTVRTLQFLCHTLRASRVLQIGTFTGAATLGLAEALPPHGRVMAVEEDAFLADFARKQLSMSSSGEKVSIASGDVLALLQSLQSCSEKFGEGFQLIFIDGIDRHDYAACFERIVECDLLAPGGILVVDDVLWQGAAFSSDHDDHEAAQSLTNFNQLLAADRRFEPVILPIQNGLALVRRRAMDEVLGDLQLTPGQPAKVSVSLSSEFEDFELGPSADHQHYDSSSATEELQQQQQLHARHAAATAAGWAMAMEAPGWSQNQAAYTLRKQTPNGTPGATFRKPERSMSLSSDGSNANNGCTYWPATPEDSPMLRPSMPWTAQHHAVA